MSIQQVQQGYEAIITESAASTIQLYVEMPWTCTVGSQKYAHPRKYAHSPFSLKVIAKGHLLLESMPTQQTKIICSSMHSDEIRSVHVCVG